MLTGLLAWSMVSWCMVGSSMVNGRGGSGGAEVGQCLEAIGLESGEVVVGADVDDGGLQVAQRHDVLAGFGVGGNVDAAVFDIHFVEGTENGVALHAGGLCVDDDGVHC